MYRTRGLLQRLSAVCPSLSFTAFLLLLLTAGAFPKKAPAQTSDLLLILANLTPDTVTEPAFLDAM